MLEWWQVERRVILGLGNRIIVGERCSQKDRRGRNCLAKQESAMLQSLQRATTVAPETTWFKFLSTLQKNIAQENYHNMYPLYGKSLGIPVVSSGDA